jgi:hypothetical protein
LFAGSTWLVSKVEHDLMFSADPPGGARPETYSALKNSKTVLITTAEHDVFGDGTVIIKQAPGHTEGHSVLYLKLAKTGPVVLSGDLYHYPAERKLGRLPTFEVISSASASSSSRRSITIESCEATGAAANVTSCLRDGGGCRSRASRCSPQRRRAALQRPTTHRTAVAGRCASTTTSSRSKSATPTTRAASPTR